MRRLFTATALLVILLACSWPLLHTGFFRVHDYTHGARIVEMTQAVTDGHIPPQWSKHFGYGYGMPLFLFYAPLPYYFGALIYWLSGSLILSVSALFWAANVITILGAYFLGKRIFSSLGGVLLAAAVALAPYRAVNLFIRGAVSETWGIAASIWLLLGFVLVLKKEKHGWLILCLSTVALLLSHNLITMMFLPFFTVFATVIILYRRAWSEAVTTFFSTALGFGIAAFYIFPAFLEKSNTQVAERILTQYFDFHLHFLYLRQFVTPYWGYGGSIWGPNDDISFFLGYGMLFGLAITIGLLFRQAQKRKFFEKKSLITLLSLILGAVAVLLTTQKSLFVWESISLFKFIQFPWRFLSIVIIFFSLALTGGIIRLSGGILRFILVLLLLVVLLGNARYFRPEAYLDNPEFLYSEDQGQVSENMSGILPDFLPQGFDEQILPLNPEMLLLEPELPNQNILVDRTHEKLVFLELDLAQNIVFAVADFPGWQVEIDGEKIEHKTTSAGLIQVAVPSGAHYVGVLFSTTLIRTWANSISLISLLVLLFILLRQEKK
ncbi:MAG: hypothetical protein COU67_00770 [Candidatus Pacebacteria bacterium CG10_big_fil_rev_8_21_14_0_10_44_54]|nr:hypothetical protein [Candidatus Paceibacterota bacterium]PIR60802.1 MAG: hypothetical protein COU67_00770 [Candidatus Pacebacteria bacterium CG10_big_fil_rev_8_21_14_0_10_44_54]